MPRFLQIAVVVFVLLAALGLTVATRSDCLEVRLRSGIYACQNHAGVEVRDNNGSIMLGQDVVCNLSHVYPHRGRAWAYKYDYMQIQSTFVVPATGEVTISSYSVPMDFGEREC